MTERTAAYRRRMAALDPAGLSDEQLLAWLLSFSLDLPRAEETAALLLDRFHTLREVLCATGDALTEAGLPPRAALSLMLVPDLRAASALSSLSDCDGFHVASATGRFLCEMFAGARRERLGMLYLDDRMRPLSAAFIGDGSDNAVSIHGRRILDLALRCGATRAVAAHNHLHGTLLPSEADVESTQRLSEALSGVAVTLIEHFIVCGGRYRPILLFEDRLPTAAPCGYYDCDLHLDCRRERGD